MSDNMQFRFAVHAGITIVYPVGSSREPATLDRFLQPKFAISGFKSVRIIYPVEGLECFDPKVIKARKDRILAILNGPQKAASNTLLNAIARGLGLAAD